MGLLRRLYSTASKNLYKTLGVSETASAPEIKKAYFELAKRYHPDTCKESGAKERFVEIQEAYETLSDPNKKAMYDNYGAAADAAGGSTGFDAAGFNTADIFGSIFSNFSNGRAPFSSFTDESPMPSDIEASLHLNFLEAALGCEKKIKYQRTASCDSCNGTGSAKGHSATLCSTCRGSGQETSFRSGMIFSRTCRPCNGAGRINLHPCAKCHGKKVTQVAEDAIISIPAGVSEESFLRLDGKGNCVGKRCGDLFVRLTVARSSLFERKGRDIYSAVKIDLLTALTGGDVAVSTIHGDVSMKISPGSQPDELKKLSHKGINDPSKGSGHHYVRLKLEIPKYNFNRTKLRSQTV